MVDARGAERLLAIYIGPAGAYAECWALVAPSGAVIAGVGNVGGGTLATGAAGQIEVTSSGVTGGADVDTVQYVTGQAGAAISRVVFDVNDIGLVRATLNNGRFAAWWRVDEPLRPAGAPGGLLPRKAYSVAGYDALGQSVDRIGEPEPGLFQ